MPEIPGEGVERRAVDARRCRTTAAPHPRMRSAVLTLVRAIATYQMVNTWLMPTSAPDISIAADLDGKRIAITGGTGFLGTALIERLLRSVPGCELVLLIRAGPTPHGRAAGQARDLQERRLRPAPSKPCGRRRTRRRVLRRHDRPPGDADRRRRRAPTASASTMPAAPPCASCDIVIHSAATVSFDSPLDSAVEVNLLGPSRIAATLHDLFDDPVDLPHLVAVSTCYVAGNRKGSAPEEPVDESPYWFGVDWRDEVAAARRTRADAEAESRRPDMLKRFRADARRELGAAGTPLLAAKTEQNRSRWVGDQLVDAGRSRAASLGWPDAYAYTKALGEKALSNSAATSPSRSCARRSSSRRSPSRSPGWIRGFRMAEPVIISYARGLLKEFPGVPEGIIDVIPVDLVVRRDLRRRRRRPARTDDGRSPDPASCSRPRARPTRCATATSSTTSAAGSPSIPSTTTTASRSSCPSGTSPAAAGCRRQLERAKSILEKSESVLQALPLRGKQAEWAATLEEKREEAERALTYVELYGAYAECEAIYGVTELLSLWDRCDAEPPRRPSGSIPGSSTGTATSARSTSRRWCSTPASRPRPARTDRESRSLPSAPPGPRTPSARSSPSTSRTRSSPRTSWPATRGSPPDDCRPTIACGSWLAPWPRRRACCRSTARTAATSSATSTVATRAPTRPSSTPTPSRWPATCCSPSRSPPPSAGSATTAGSATAPCSSPGRWAWPSSRSSRCSTTSSAPR